ncbi:MAG TPA: S53 family peptidase [Jatrophihabitans sp.]|jgi:subtilase family serine protease|uniref:S53 family peptidase n=1 Tax=Jatrophihabitans sp. TaxID=1932789 RepID=UPI002DFDD11D|nr:S53 family peptidase [Jatrophihabitans sp.]
MQKRSITAAIVTTGAVVASALTSTGAASAAPSAKAVPNTKPAWTAHAKHLGAAGNSAAISARVYLAPNGGLAAVQRFATAASTPGTAAYGHFLTAAQYRARFGTTSATVRSVSSYLRSAGLTVNAVGAHNRYVSITGTVRAAEKAFGAQIERYSHNGRNVQAPAGTLSVPSTLASSILTVTGLDTTPKIAKPATKQAAPAPDGFRNARPCSRYYGQVAAKYQADFKTPLPTFNGQTLSYAPCGYTGPQFRAAYEGNTALDGTGVTVAITDAYAAPTIAKDANTYAVNHGDGSYAPGQLTQTKPAKFTNQKTCGPSGWYGEETLDVEAVHAMAPGAKIHYYASASCNDADFLDALATVVDDGTSQLVSNSWGDLEANESADGVAAYEAVFVQGAAEGTSFLFSSGDNGDELANSGIKQADYPTSDPYVTSVGGTSTAIGANGKIAFQTGWGTAKYSLSSDAKSWNPVGYLYGSGGGTSSLFQQPAYQAGTTSSPYRQDPDVAMDGDPNTGMLVGETQTFPNGVYYDEYRIGGTSLASPLFAGMTALSLQKAGHAVGLLNPTIYAQQATAFTDVKGNPPQAGDVRVDFVNGIDGTDGLSYSVRTFDQDSTLRTTRGYDLTTGVGAPNPKWLTAIS